ncbi:hypothetical protein ACM66B_000069 [Microbotryomycetes sp. NB124-2]
MALVSYGSDSEDESADVSIQSSSAAPQASTSSSKSIAGSFMNLPPPRSMSSSTATTPLSNTTSTDTGLSKPAAKKAKGPLRMVLDLPASTSNNTANATLDDSNEQPAKKKLKLGSGATGGLAALLPQPKNNAATATRGTAGQALGAGSASASSSGVSLAMGLPPPSSSSSKSTANEPSTAFVPHTISNKGKAKAETASTVSNASEVDVVQEDAEDAGVAPAIDFFGISSVSSNATPTAAKPKQRQNPRTAMPSSSSTVISAAPSVAEFKPPEPKKPTLDDPYPGFTQLPSGEWVAKDQETYDKWMQALASQQQQQQAQAPKGFEDSEVSKMGGMVDMTDEMKRAREAWAKKPDVIGRPGQAESEAEKEKALANLKVPAVGLGRARAKGQLSALLADAYSNRAELEERIAQAKANRKSAGNKYGF